MFRASRPMSFSSDMGGAPSRVTAGYSSNAKPRDLLGASLMIHAGRAVKAVAGPHNFAAARLARAAIRAVYQGQAPELLEAHEHVDSMMLVMAWFRKYPKELTKTLTPEQALALCA